MVLIRRYLTFCIGQSSMPQSQAILDFRPCVLHCDLDAWNMLTAMTGSQKRCKPRRVEDHGIAVPRVHLCPRCIYSLLLWEFPCCFFFLANFSSAADRPRAQRGLVDLLEDVIFLRSEVTNTHPTLFYQSLVYIPAGLIFMVSTSPTLEPQLQMIAQTGLF